KEVDVLQRVRIHLEMEVSAKYPIDDKIQHVVCYDLLKKRLQEVLKEQPHLLIETIADLLATHCLTDKKVKTVKVQVEKLDVYDDCIVAVEVNRQQD
ncbi:MAG TPA: dihydroneopterin aldolase, partial [Alphaproteobacteria bacterium]|nr:dihydroneopterin aldolase [Alphaproteobacteria bacterium]